MKNPMKALPRIRGSATVAVCALVLALSGSASSAWANTISVTTLKDNGAGSLRKAINDAAPGDTITFSVHGTIKLKGGALVIGKNLDIEGPGPQYLKVSGNRASRVFVILAGEVTLAGMTISDGLADGNSTVPVPVPVDTHSVGGAILNFSALVLSDVVLSDNQAIGDASGTPLAAIPYDSDNPGYPGSAWGGAVANAGMLAVNDSAFIGNLARGADGVIDSPTNAGFGSGGGIANVGILTVIHSRFTRNQAIGGNNNSSNVFPGHAPGGAILSSGPLVVEDSEFSHNQAIGGNGNIAAAPPDFGANKSTGGAINVAGGTATIDGCTFEHNWSIGGTGESDKDGGIGAGGAVMVTNVSGFGTKATVTNSKIEHNIALGGPGSAGHNGGNGQGGGFISAAAGILIVGDGTTVAHNHAEGGPGGEGGNGGSGLGGGFYDQSGLLTGPAVLELQGAIVTKNLALGGEAGNGGSEGEGIGGGVYRLGTYSADSSTIEKNQATTSNDNVGP
jgi:hypothetical protein